MTGPEPDDGGGAGDGLGDGAGVGFGGGEVGSFGTGNAGAPGGFDLAVAALELCVSPEHAVSPAARIKIELKLPANHQR